jgi:hypothetical protein
MARKSNSWQHKINSWQYIAMAGPTFQINRGPRFLALFPFNVRFKQAQMAVRGVCEKKTSGFGGPGKEFFFPFA